MSVKVFETMTKNQFGSARFDWVSRNAQIKCSIHHLNVLALFRANSFTFAAASASAAEILIRLLSGSRQKEFLVSTEII